MLPTTAPDSRITGGSELVEQLVGVHSSATRTAPQRAAQFAHFQAFVRGNRVATFFRVSWEVVEVCCRWSFPAFVCFQTVFNAKRRSAIWRGQTDKNWPVTP